MKRKFYKDSEFAQIGVGWHDQMGYLVGRNDIINIKTE